MCLISTNIVLGLSTLYFSSCYLSNLITATRASSPCLRPCNQHKPVGVHPSHRPPSILHLIHYHHSGPTITGGEREGESEEKKSLQDVWSIKEIATYGTYLHRVLLLLMPRTYFSKSKLEELLRHYFLELFFVGFFLANSNTKLST